jgi:hypothetical protein
MKRNKNNTSNNLVKENLEEEDIKNEEEEFCFQDLNKREK